MLNIKKHINYNAVHDYGYFFTLQNTNSVCDMIKARSFMHLNIVKCVLRKKKPKYAMYKKNKNIIIKKNCCKTIERYSVLTFVSNIL